MPEDWRFGRRDPEFILVFPRGGQRALAGGDARFGGVLDLCSVSRLDEREGMVLRLAVIRRERMTIA